MSAIQCQTPKLKHPSESRVYGVDFTRLLTAGETLTGTPTVTVSPSGVTATSPAVNSSTFEDDDEVTIAVGKGVQVRLAGGSDSVDYLVTVTVGTSQSNTLVVIAPLQVRAT